MVEGQEMRFVIDRDSIRIIPDSDQDIAFIEDTLGLKDKCQCIELRRVNAHNLSSLAELRACSTAKWAEIDSWEKDPA